MCGLVRLICRWRHIPVVLLRVTVWWNRRCDETWCGSWRIRHSCVLWRSSPRRERTNIRVVWCYSRVCGIHDGRWWRDNWLRQARVAWPNDVWRSVGWCKSFGWVRNCRRERMKSSPPGLEDDRCWSRMEFSGDEHFECNFCELWLIVSSILEC